MRLVPTAATIWFASDFLLTRIPAPTFAACGCAAFGMAWITYVAYRTAAERKMNGNVPGRYPKFNSREGGRRAARPRSRRRTNANRPMVARAEGIATTAEASGTVEITRLLK
jgi:hypothetical protein